MENKMSAKIKWAIALLLIRILSAFSVGGDTARMLGLSHDYAYYFVFSALYEQLPTIAAVILIFYNHKQPKTENTGFTLMQKWIFALVWVQHAYAFIAFALADSLTSVWAKILGGCVWLGVITYLLYSAWKQQKTVSAENKVTSIPEQPKEETLPPLPYVNIQPTTQEDNNSENNKSNVGYAIVACCLFIVFFGIILGVIIEVLSVI